MCIENQVNSYKKKKQQLSAVWVSVSRINHQAIRNRLLKALNTIAFSRVSICFSLTSFECRVAVLIHVFMRHSYIRGEHTHTLSASQNQLNNTIELNYGTTTIRLSGQPLMYKEMMVRKYYRIFSSNTRLFHENVFLV